MQEKTIRWTIYKKMDAFCQTLPDELEKDVRKNLFVAGGAIASLACGYDPNDYDVYIADPDVLERLSQYLIEQFMEKERKKGKNRKKMPSVEAFRDGDRVRVKIQSSGIASESEKEGEYQYFEQQNPLIGADWVQTTILRSTKPGKKSEDETYDPTFITENAISLGNADIQIITRFSGPPEETVESFDFDHVKNYFWMSSGKIVWKTDALVSLQTRTLSYKGSDYPLCALIRTRKFLLRGFKCPVDIYVRIAFELNALDLKDPAVLADQLIGVDFAYFVQLIRYIEADLKENPDMTIDNTYICQALEKINELDPGQELKQLDIMQQEALEESNGE